MNYEAILNILRIYLQISVHNMDALLEKMIIAAEQAIMNEGITLIPGDEADEMLVVQYAAWLYDKRKEDVPMSRMLRWQLNNRLLKEKAGVV